MAKTSFTEQVRQSFDRRPKWVSIINGVRYEGNSISVSGGKVIVDGVVLDIWDQKVININIEGNMETIDIDVCSSFKMRWDAWSITTISGDVSIEWDVWWNVKTVSGDVDCHEIQWSVKTISGDIG